MIKETLLRKFCRDYLKTILYICSKYPIQKKHVTEFKFKKNQFNAESKILIKDFHELLSRDMIKKQIEDDENFNGLKILLSSNTNLKQIFQNAIDDSTTYLIYYFIENYLNDNNSIKFNQANFDRLFNEFKYFIVNDIMFIPYFTPLFGFNSNVKGKIFGDIALKQITSKQFRIIKEDLVGNSSPTPTQMYDLKYVLETRSPIIKNRIEEDHIIEKKFTLFIDTCLLFQAGYPHTGSYYRNYTKWTKQSSTVTNKQINIVKNPYVIKKNKLTKLQIFYDRLALIRTDTSNSTFIKIAIKRFHMAISRPDINDKIMDLNIALESLFSSPGDTSTKFRNRICTIMTEDDTEREFYWEFIKEMYKLRSDIVHGRKSKPFHIQNKDMSIDHIVFEIENITRISINKFLNLRSFYHGTNIREMILDDIDLGLINRTKLTDLLKKTDIT